MDKIKALEQLSLRLSYMADGVDEEVDTILASIRKLLREDAEGEKLEVLSGHLARTMMTETGISLDQRQNLEGGYDLSGLRKLIKTMPVHSDEQQRMNQLVQQVASGSTTMARQKALVDLLGAAAGALREVASRDKPDAGVLSWLGKKSAKDSDDERYVGLFVQLLRRLVEHIDVLNGHSMRSRSIKDALDHVVHPDQAQHILDEVTDEIESIDARIRAERNQTTDFLGDLRERLDGFEEVLNVLAADGDQSLERSKELQASIGKDTRDLDEAVKLDDIGRVREAIALALASVTERLVLHVSSEAEQNEASRARVAELNERLVRLEDEADILRMEIRNKNDLALKDSLTGAYNRAGYEERARELTALWERSGVGLSMVFVDCNKFKEINDNYGHAAGDLVLVKVASVLQSRARGSDIVCRYGGDEFVILLPDTHATGAEVFARRACQEVLESGFNDNGRPLDVSISCGVTEFAAGDSIENAVSRADKAMYEAKKVESDVKVCVAQAEI